MDETTAHTTPFLAAPIDADDPPAYELFNPTGKASLLLICDHASRAIPAEMGSLGLDPASLERHIAYDIGAANVTRRLAERLDAPAVLAGYSRLVIDCNRQPGDPQSIPEVSYGTAVPGNRRLANEALEQRVEAFFWPYHHAVINALAHMWRAGRPPALFSVHSFTPDLEGEDRYWDIGVLWSRDPRMALPLIEKLRALDGLHVGDNEPYSGKEVAYSIDLHAEAAGLANCAVEIRQDHLESEAGAERWAAMLAVALSETLAIEGMHRVEHY